MAAGAIVTAEGLWVPGSKLISIPKKQFYGTPITELIRINDWTYVWIDRV